MWSQGERHLPHWRRTAWLIRELFYRTWELRLLSAHMTLGGGCAIFWSAGVNLLLLLFVWRDLLVKVELGVVGEDARGCTVAARTRLPPGIYVDPYELASLQQHNLTKVTTPKLRHLAFSQIRTSTRAFCVVCCWYFHTQACLPGSHCNSAQPQMRSCCKSCSGCGDGRLTPTKEVVVGST